MSTSQIIIVDDGRFFIDLNTTYEARKAPGFLNLRCFQGSASRAFHCIGSFDIAPDGMWRANVAIPYDHDLDANTRTVIAGVGRLEAITALWRIRHDAYQQA